MDFLERDLEDIIYEHMGTTEGRAKLRARGLKMLVGSVVLMRQPHFGPYGVADIVEYTITRLRTWDVKDRRYLVSVNIFELKKGPITIDTINQVCRYKRAIEEVFEEVQWSYSGHLELNIHTTLIGRTLNFNNHEFIVENLNRLNIFTYSYDFDGLRFEYYNGLEYREFDSRKLVETVLGFNYKSILMQQLREAITEDRQNQ